MDTAKKAFFDELEKLSSDNFSIADALATGVGTGAALKYFNQYAKLKGNPELAARHATRLTKAGPAGVVALGLLAAKLFGEASSPRVYNYH